MKEGWVMYSEDFAKAAKQACSLLTEIEHAQTQRNTLKMENFKNIDLSGYKWPKYGITDTHLERCKETARAFAHKTYGNWDIVKLWEDTYPLYLEQDFDAKTVEELVKRDSAIVRRYGWAQYAWSELPQGWWHFIEYIAQHYN